MYETESDKFSFYTLLNLPLPDYSFYFVPLQVTNFYFNLIQFRMKQKVITFTHPTGDAENLDIEIQKRIDANHKYKVAQISTCYCPVYDLKDGSLKYPLLSVTLLMEEV